MIERTSDLSAVRDDWTRLAVGGNIFATWEWADAWARHLGTGAHLTIGVVRDGEGEATTIVPLCVRRRGVLRVARFIGSSPADQLGPLHAAAADPGEVSGALRHHVVDTLHGGGLFLGERMWGGEPLHRDFGSALIHRTASPVLPTHGASFEDYLGSRSRNFRSQVRRRERKLHASGHVAYRLTADPDELDADMKTLMGLHAARWSGPNAFSGPLAGFHRDFARRALRNGWLRLWTLELDGSPVAAWYGLRYGGVEFYYQAGRDPAYDSLHVGFVLLCHTIRSAFEDGMHEYRFGRGDEAYKSRFAECDPELDTMAIAAGAQGRLALAGVKALLRIPQGARETARRSLSEMRSPPGERHASRTAARRRGARGAARSFMGAEASPRR